MGPVEVLLFGVVGFLVGVGTGLVPGLHVNNAALIFASATPVLASFSVEPEMVAVLVVAAAVSHTFFDVVPSVLLGAPEPSTALTVLPGHRLLMEGRAGEAVRLSALGSGAAVVLAILMAYPVKLLFERIYSELLPFLGWVLLLISAVMVVSERGEHGFEVPGRAAALRARGAATFVFLLSGALGLVALRAGSLGAVEPLLGVEASVMFPLLTGLFGTSTLLLSLGSAASPPAQSAEPVGVSRLLAARSVVGGTVSGTLVGWLPGVTSAQAAVLAGQLSGDDGELSEGDGARTYLVSVSSVNSANAVFTLVALYTIGRTRSGAMVAFDDLVRVARWTEGAPPMFLAALLAVAVSGLLSYVALSSSADGLAGAFTGVNYDLLSVTVLAGLAVAALLFTGFFGLQVMVVATAVGVLPPLLGVRRTHCMGSLLLPIMLYFFGVRGLLL